MSQTEISDEELVERDDGYTEEEYNYTEQREIQEADDVLQTDDGGGDDDNTVQFYVIKSYFSNLFVILYVDVQPINDVTKFASKLMASLIVVDVIRGHVA